MDPEGSSVLEGVEGQRVFRIETLDSTSWSGRLRRRGRTRHGVKEDVWKVKARIFD